MTSVDPEYAEARRVLLDALEALAPHAPALVIAGAQAVYMRVGDGDLAVAPYTTDADITVDPQSLAPDPTIEAVMTAAGFAPLLQGGSIEPGIWVAKAVINGREMLIPVDLIVPEGFAPPGGRRGARLGPHGNKAARRAIGLEAALVDNGPMTVSALDPADGRSVSVAVAGEAALMVAKAHKLHDRLASGRPDRSKDKDAGDVIRMMRVAPAKAVGATMAELNEHPIAGAPTIDAMTWLDELFGRRGRPGIEMAARSFGGEIPLAQVEALCVAYIAALRDAYRAA